MNIYYRVCMEIVNKKIIASVLYKHTAAIHTSAPLTRLQSNIVNILLKNAYKDLLEDKFHMISIKDLCKELGYKNSTEASKTFRECLKELNCIQIEWNILGKVKAQAFEATTWLSSVGIFDGMIRYSYSKAIREVFFQPSLYAKLDLTIQKKFTHKTSVLLWEYLCEVLSVRKQQSTQTDWITYEDFLKINGLEASYHVNRYALFKARILEPAIDEINQHADVNVELIEKRGQRKKITHICFKTSWKKSLKEKIPKHSLRANDYPEGVVLDLEAFVNKRLANELLNKYSISEIKNAIDYVKNELKYRSDKIHNVVALLTNALEKGWIKTEAIELKLANNKEETVTCVASEIQNSDDPELIKALRLSLLKSLGLAIYQSWLHPLCFRLLDDMLIVYAKTPFILDRIENHYKQGLNDALRKCNIHVTRIDFQVDKQLLIEG